MPFVVPTEHLFGPPFLPLYAMKMRLCLFALAQDLDRGRLGEALRSGGAGWWISTGAIRSMIGPASANDARAITRATMEIKLDSAFDAIQMDRSGRGLSFLLTDGLSSMPYLARYALLDIAQIRHARTMLELMLMLQIAQVGRMRAPQFRLACDDLSRRLRKGQAIDSGWIRRTCLPTAQRFTTDRTWAIYVGAICQQASPHPSVLEFRLANATTTKWRKDAFERTSPLASAFLVRESGITALARRKVRPAQIEPTCLSDLEMGA